MAVKDESLYHATKDLILLKPWRLFPTQPTERRDSHWQLRSLISSPSQNVVYFPSGCDVISLNTKTRERSIVATLSFSPKCLAASKTLICCGGEKGDHNYATISLSGNGTPLGSRSSTDADARLPLDLSLPSTPRPQSDTPSVSRDDGLPISIKYSKVGGDIVNCITIWAPPDNCSERIYGTPVAVVSNNDCSVWMLDLHTSEVLEKLKLPDCVNRSVMSPSGEYLISLCDDPYLYVHERKPKSKSRSDRTGGQNHEWGLSCRIQLQGQRVSDGSKMKGSFAACFSPSGNLLAVATQYGIISIFDMDRITEPGSLRLTFTNSRPEDEEGAVRDMAFSPLPFDLLAWTESSGRIAVADVRTLFMSRQLLSLDPGHDGAEKVVVVDRQAEMIDPRLRTLRTGSSRGSTPDYLGLAERSRQHSMLERPDAYSELEVLEAHRDARRQRDLANAALVEGASVSRWGMLSTETQRALSSLPPSLGIRNGSSERRISTAGLPAPLREFVNADRGPHSLRSFMNDRNRENERRNRRQHEFQEVERNSVLLQLAEYGDQTDQVLQRQSRNGSESISSLARLTLSQSRASQDHLDPREGDHTFRIDADAGYPPPPLPPAPADLARIQREAATMGRSARLRIEFENEDDRNFAHRLRQPWRPMGDHAYMDGTQGLDYDGERVYPMITRGICWSEDGRVLYAAIEAGVYEFHVNVLGRKCFPNLVPR